MDLSVHGAAALKVEAAAQPLRPKQNTAGQASSLLQPLVLKLAPEGDEARASADAPDLAPAPTNAINGNEAEQLKAGEKFRRLIDPIINPERYQELRSRFGRKTDLLKHIASENGVCVKTVERTLKRWEEQGINGLTRKIRADKGIHLALNDAGREFILGAALPKPHSYGELSTKDIFRLYEEELRWRADHAGKPLCPTDRARYRRYVGADGCLLPSAQLTRASYPTFCRYVAQMPELVKTMARKGEDSYRDGELIISRDMASVQLLDYVIFDHRVLDIFTLVRDRNGWRTIRPWITAAIDMRSRKWLGWCFVETPSSDSIATVLKQVFLDFGLPKSVYWDRGRDFMCQWLQGRKEKKRTVAAIGELPEKWAGVMESLGVRVHHAIAYNARAKLIEPNFQNIANFDRTLPEWCGHKPGARPERFDRLIKEHEAWMSGERESTPFRTIEQIAALYTDFIERDLNERPHQGSGMRKVLPRGMGWYCPNEIWELGIGRVPRRSVPADVLQLCFAKRREATIRNGEIGATFGGRQYHYRLEGDPLGLLALNGRKVLFGYDPQDLGEIALYREDGQFIALARSAELRRMSEDGFVEDIRNQRTAQREMKRFVAAVHQAVPIPDAETHLARRRAVVPARVPPERANIPAQIPAGIAAAHAAKQAERAAALESVTVPRVERQPESDDDGSFSLYAYAAGNSTGESEMQAERQPETDESGRFEFSARGTD